MTGQKLLALGLSLLAAGIAHAQANAGGARSESHDLRLTDKARAAVVERSCKGQGKLIVKRGSREVTQGIDVDERVRWIDQISPQDDFVVNRRTFLEWHETVNGLNHDPGLEGVSLVMTTKSGSEAEVTAEVPRRTKPTEIRTQIRQADAAGLYAVLPDDAAIGAKFAFQGQALVATLLHVEQDIHDFSSEMTLVRVDREADRAFLTGEASFSVTVEGGGLAWGLRHEAAVSIEVDLAAREIARVTVKGNATASELGDSETRISGGLEFAAECTAKGVKDVAKLTRKKPVFRQNTLQVFGVELELGSYWISIPSEPGMKKLVDSRTEDVVLIELANLGADQDPSSDEFIEGFTKIAKKASADAKVQKANLAPGPGLTFELTADDGSKVRGCVVLVGDSMIRLRIVGSANALKKADSEYQALIASLRKETP